jgi:hypothetical protein
MAGEISRKVSVRRITAPDDDSVYVDLKIIDQIRFVDPQDKYQEWELSYENNLNAGRQVRVVDVGDENLQVERIDFLRKVIAGYRFQEWENEYNNGDDPPVHYETHKRKIYALEADGVTKNEDIWIEVQRIDKILFKDPKDHYQEKIWELKWPDLENEEWDYQDLTDPVTDWDGTSINPPWRLDPYQTIVDCSFGARYMMVLYGSSSVAAIPMSKVAAPEVSFTVTSASFGSPAYWKSFSGPLYFHVAQVKLSETVHAMATQVNFSGGRIAPATRGGQEFVYNTQRSLLESAEACEPLTDSNVVYPATSYYNVALCRPYLSTSVTYGSNYVPEGERHYGWVAGDAHISWSAFSAYASYDRVIAYDTNGIKYKTGSDWYLFAGPIINGSGTNIYNERGDVFSASGAITRTTTGSTATVYSESLEDDVPVNLYQYVGMVSASGVRKGVWATREKFMSFGTPQVFEYVYPYDISPNIGDAGNDSFGLYRQISGTTIESSESAIQSPIWKKVGGLDVYDDTNNITYSFSLTTLWNLTDNIGTHTLCGRTLTRPSDTGWQGCFIPYSFPYAIEAAPDKIYMLEVAPLDLPAPTFDPAYAPAWDNALQYPADTTVVTPYGNFSSPCWVFAFRPWMHVSNGEHTLQAFIIADSPTSFSRYMYLDGTSYISTLATAIGCATDDIRAVYFDIKGANIRALSAE